RSRMQGTKSIIDMNDEEVAALSAAISEREDRGWRHVGWKLGFGSPTGMETLGLTKPLVGALFDAGREIPGATIPCDHMWVPMVEPEIAAWVGGGTSANASADDLMSAISSLVPAIEVADVTFAPDSSVKVVRENIYQYGWTVADDDESGWAEVRGRTIDITYGGEQWSQDDPESMTGSLVEGLVQCNDVAHRLGRGILAGDVVFLGSVIPPQPIREKRLEIHFLDGRGVSATFTRSGGGQEPIEEGS
ncbi:MAG: hypothetical protein ISQ77_06590, partial [Candidatus Nanopelagicales bacterium]|nr:hypothetical protein [Candidatus Nanopelagicales bacterium]